MSYADSHLSRRFDELPLWAYPIGRDRTGRGSLMSQTCNWHRLAASILTLGLAGTACGSIAPEAPAETASIQQQVSKPPPPPPPIRGFYWNPNDTWLPQGNVSDVMSVAIQTTPSVLAAFGTTGPMGDTVQVRTYSDSTQRWDVGGVIPGKYAALSNNVLAVGTPDVDVSIYRIPNYGTHTTLTPTLPVASSEFGRSLALDGSILVVGAPSYNLEEGRAFIFELVPGGIFRFKPFWQQTAILGESSPAATAVSPIADSFLGAGVSVSGSVVAVGQTPDFPDANGRKGRVFLFEKQATGWALVDTVFAHDPVTGQIIANGDANAESFGKALLVKGNTLAVRSDRYVQLFTRSLSSGAVQWTFTTSFDTGLSSSSFWDRPLAFDGDELISGDSFEDGHAGRVFPLMGTLSHPVPTIPWYPFIEDSPARSGDYFGQCIATGGGWLLVGNHHNQIRVYERTPFY